MDLFNVYITDFEAVYEEARRKVESIVHLTGDPLNQSIQEAWYSIGEARQLINNMSVTAHHFNNTDNSQVRINLYKKKIQDLSNILKQTKEHSDRKQLINMEFDIQEPSKSAVDRHALLDDTIRLEEGSKLINRATSVAFGARETGQETLETLSHQRTQILGQQTQLQIMQTKLRESGRIILAIGLRMTTNDIIKTLIVFSCLCFTIAIVYLRWIRPHT